MENSAVTPVTETSQVPCITISVLGNDKIPPIADVAARARAVGNHAHGSASPPRGTARPRNRRGIADDPVVDNLRRAYAAVLGEPMPLSLADLLRRLE